MIVLVLFLFASSFFVLITSTGTSDPALAK